MMLNDFGVFSGDCDGYSPFLDAKTCWCAALGTRQTWPLFELSLTHRVWLLELGLTGKGIKITSHEVGSRELDEI